ncbi:MULTISPECIES: hypothetical protein [Streptomyces]|uniref:Phage tail protein n=1 Tax=Streptomyces evansiae TaxID=3075535 RepID=A0ABU2RAA5_9ACTN|nr:MULTISPECIES: hypothetical protein [unclassified Streptomyces]MDT0412244.1 hypothetical protein [Streptomyces sp. DSM 41979]MYQ55843.1 hypothetical protein [Streptomyces sp. SID4926]SCE59699.1 hypothetical protein GA0115252_17676 [Streptomyces sp. DfronAA-171]
MPSSPRTAYAPLTPVYRAVFCDLRTDQVIDVLPLTDTKFDDYIGKAGSLSATVPLPDAALAARARTALVPGRTAVWLERDGDIWWGGVLWTRTPSSDERGRVQVEFQAGTFDSYLDHRILAHDFTATATDQFDLARMLVAHAQEQPGGDIGIQLGSEVSGIARDASFAVSGLTRIRELLDQIAQFDSGFEWRVRCYRDAEGRRAKRLQLGHPVISGSAEDLVLDHPGQVLTYSLPADSTVQADVWVARGDSPNADQAEESQPLTVSVESPEDLAAGWPRLESTSDHSGVTDPAVLRSLAQAQLARQRMPEVIPEITVRLDGRISPALLGANVRLRLRDLWHQEPEEERFRVVGIAIEPPQRAKAETATLYLEGM